MMTGLNTSMMTDLNASMMTDNMNIMTVLYSASWKIQPVEILTVLSIHWSAWMCEILHVLWEQDNKA